jgi:hypothetical protein
MQTEYQIDEGVKLSIKLIKPELNFSEVIIYNSGSNYHKLYLYHYKQIERQQDGKITEDGMHRSIPSC